MCKSVFFSLVDKSAGWERGGRGEVVNLMDSIIDVQIRVL